MQQKQSPLIKNNNSKTVYLKSVLMLILLFALIFIEAVFNGSYLDEVIGIVSLVYLACSIKRISRADFITILLLLLVISIGLISNLAFHLNNSIVSIFIDVLTQIKVILTYFAVKYFLTDKEITAVFNTLIPASKIFAIAALIFGILSQFVDLGMTNGERYGIKSYGFFFDFNFQYTSTFMLVFAVLVCNTKMSEKKRKIYYIISLIAIGFSTKSPALVFIVCFLFLYFYFKKYKKLSIKVLIPIAIVILLFGTFQINEYLLDDTSPRHVFFEYAFKTANRFFPLGSGFATFGSAQAARDYSVLYYEYGFDKMWGLSPEYPMFLHDNYWQTIIGQFGYIGFVIFIVVYLRLFNSLPNRNVDFAKKAFMYATFAQYMIHATGAGIMTSSSGMIGFIVLALCTTKSEESTEQTKLPKIKFKFN